MKMKPTNSLNPWTLPAVAIFSIVAMDLLGCSAGLAPATRSSVTTSAKPTIAGRVHGGQQPVSGATIQLYAAGTVGIQSAATPLIASTVTTDANGGFNITGDWDCTSNTAAYGTNPELYIVATGGNPGFSGNVNNSALAMMAALGSCSNLTAASFITINEVTTVASVVALTPFMADIAHVGASSLLSTGLANAFITANLLANMGTGTTPGSLPAGVTVPVAAINTLANIVAACVNSNGTGSSCTGLFNAATPSGGTAPANTIAAMLNINSNPGNNVVPLLVLSSTQPPFQPALNTPPNDWTVALNFTGGGLSAPTGIAMDATGDAWVANAGGNSVTEISSNGTLLTGASGYSGSDNILGAQGIAVDKSGNVWLADTLLSSIVELNMSKGAIQSSASYTSGGISGPIGIAIDSQNNVWVANFAGASVTELNSAGTSLGSSPLTAGGTLQAPYGIAIDSGGNAWVTDNAASDVVEFSNNQSLLSGSGNTDSAILAPEGIAIDANGRAWIAYQGTNSASYFFNGLNATVATPYTGGGLSMPAAVAVDGQGTVWVANSQTAGSISKLVYSQSAPVSPSTGYGVLNSPSAIAVDASGSVWTANAGDNSISEFVGIAAPATMPLAANVGP